MSEVDLLVTDIAEAEGEAGVDAGGEVEGDVAGP